MRHESEIYVNYMSLFLRAEMEADAHDGGTKNTSYPTDRESLERDCDVEFFIASGPGGQHRNKVETGVRLIHRPSGTRVTATERRSQQANRERAFERMAMRLQEQQRVMPVRKPTRPTAASRLRRLDEKRHRSQLKKQRSSSLGE